MSTGDRTRVIGGIDMGSISLQYDFKGHGGQERPPTVSANFL
jgi:hypothetical protein